MRRRRHGRWCEYPERRSSTQIHVRRGAIRGVPRIYVTGHCNPYRSSGLSDAELLGALDHAVQVGLIADRPGDNCRTAVALDAHALEREREAVADRGS
jgi:hypothetical protein